MNTPPHSRTLIKFDRAGKSLFRRSDLHGRLRSVGEVRVAPQRFGQGAASGPIQQFDRMNDRDSSSGADLGHAADIAGGDHLGLGALDVVDLAVEQAPGDLRLDQIVDTGGAAAQMAFRHLADLETGPVQQ